MRNFNAPIPGESLTGSPKKYLWERPPEMNDPEEAAQYYLEKLTTNEDAVESAMAMLENDVTIKQLTQGLVRLGVSRGLHSIDVGLLISPILHEALKSTADYLGVEYDEGLEDKKGKEERGYARRLLAAKKKLKGMGFKPAEDNDVGMEDQEPVAEDLGGIPEEGESPINGGFMQRRGGI